MGVVGLWAWVTTAALGAEHRCGMELPEGFEEEMRAIQAEVAAQGETPTAQQRADVEDLDRLTDAFLDRPGKTSTLPEALRAGRTALQITCLGTTRSTDGAVLRAPTSTLRSVARPTEVLPPGDPGIASQRAVGVRLFQALEPALGTEALLGPVGASWAALRAALDADEQLARDVAPLLDQTNPAMWALALSDDDGDGATNLAEVVVGTRPDRWDTDGDGWWDGVPTPLVQGATAVPLDGSWTCFPERPEEGTTAHLQVWVHDERGRVVEVIDRSTDDGMVTLPPVYDDAKVVGAFARLTGELEPNEECASSAHVTVRLGPGVGWASEDDDDAAIHFDRLKRWADAMEAPWAVFEERFGTLPQRAFVFVGGEHTRLLLGHGQPSRIEIRTQHFERAAKKGQLDIVAGVAVAMQVLALTLKPRGGVSSEAVALYSDVFDAKVPSGLFDTFPGEVKAWSKAAERCEDGWKGLLEKRCPGPETP